MWGSAPGLLALLTEKNPNFQIKGIRELENIVNNEWPQIADKIDLILDLAKNTEFPAHEQAARLASKIYYNLGDFNKAVEFAICAGATFDPTLKDEYTQKVSSQCIQSYIKLIEQQEKPNQQLFIIVKQVLQHLLDEKRYSSCLCLAIETRFLDYVHLCLEQKPKLVEKTISIVQNIIIDSEYRQVVLRKITDLACKHCDTFQIAQLYYNLRDPDMIADLLTQLRKSSNTDNWLMAYQIAFDLAENANQKLRSIIISLLPPDLPDLKSILTRNMLLKFYLDFLFQNNHTDIQIIVNLKENLKTTKMLIHSSVVCAYSLMFAGTGDDNFYRSNITWFGSGRKWAQFITIAGVGAIHIGHLQSALQILEPFLHNDTPPYPYGAALYALGIIYANYSWDRKVIETVKEPIIKQKSSIIKQKSSIIRNGGCLALGLIAMGSREQEYASIVRDVINDDIPEPGEAAGYAYGMIMLGVGPCQELEELVRVAENNDHEKIARGLAMCFAFMMYGKQDSAETLIAALLNHQKPILRESAAWVTALAYVGTASNVALERLLHLAVSDVNPDVRRAAVIGVGFVLSRHPSKVPSMLDLLAKSYHSHVRSGAALAVGIACAGTGMADAIEVLKPLLEDLEDFVKQHAMIAMAMVLQQQSDREVPYAKEFRRYLRKLTTRNTSEIQVFGVSVAYGILNAGGRNVAISCNTLRGENSTLATVAMALFCNYFYWLPLTLMLPLAFHPTAVIGLDKSLKVVPWEIYCNKPASLFAYPPPFESETESLKEREVVELSISRKTQEQKENKKEEKKEVDEKEPSYVILKNQSRVTLRQLKHLDFGYCEKYTPVTGEVFHGFVMLKENPEEEEEEDNILDLD
ncbi:Proteasome/cyclosome repeat family protein [Trichomonas vaginalis G3]|uniref:Proteasome/cyclosome repeat family protein n=1 Tax=Trichomonas vaginalis (strain ATCC PRA-98 / G3) TaxID=412133 RepID=A2E9F3_TRIV3|nr:26S proteasome non-ATPase regulatory subunit family [Trichomonas vaginalis G3]EAY10717.1 Proteasome/cyclosome repeat family protein [Trichomonas vaginalis G3]KAI5538610.1 26S proteasome non-ATPase regulatory subunit family [Trichomonas vaginalis G3]|eukprot:XP_001322940.1 Proteasome/cyclosome repeat family protein [Trichomonas vaginalis G3]